MMLKIASVAMIAALAAMPVIGSQAVDRAVVAEDSEFAILIMELGGAGDGLGCSASCDKGANLCKTGECPPGTIPLCYCDDRAAVCLCVPNPL